MKHNLFVDIQNVYLATQILWLCICGAVSYCKYNDKLSVGLLLFCILSMPGRATSAFICEVSDSGNRISVNNQRICRAVVFIVYSTQI